MDSISTHSDVISSDRVEGANVYNPSGTKLGQLVQETEEAVAETVESEAEAVTETKKGLWSWLLG